MNRLVIRFLYPVGIPISPNGIDFFSFLSYSKAESFACLRLLRNPKKQYYQQSKIVGAVPRTAQQARSGIGPYGLKAVSSIANPERSRGQLFLRKGANA
jgi:hypothetical protein